jgi:hypothetical protein
MAKTKLSWEDYKKAALKLRSKGLGFPKIYERLGDPYFNGELYKIESDGRGGLKKKKRSVRQANRSAATSRRTKNKNLSTPDTADTAAADAKVRKINGDGLQADHIAELSRTGNALKSMPPERQQQYFARYGTGVGHQKENLQPLSKEDNAQKNLDYRKLDKHLKNMGKNGNGNGIANGIPNGNGSTFSAMVDPVRQVVTVKPAKGFAEIMAMLAKGLA